MKVIVAGYGPVGEATYSALQGRMRVIIDDPYKDHSVTPADIEDVDGVVVCVATPQRDDGTCTTDNVRDVFKKYGKTKYLVKSAIDPVWLSKHHDEFGGSVTVSPEFLRGSHQWGNPTEEFLNQEFAIYGGPDARWWDEMFRPALKKMERVNQIEVIKLTEEDFVRKLENCIQFGPFMLI